MNLLSIEEALAKIAAIAKPIQTEVRQISEAAGYFLAEQIRASSDLPPFDNSAMDGYALRAADTIEASEVRPVQLSVVAEIAAGSFCNEPLQPKSAVKIMTGAAIPTGADTVLMLEDGRLRNGCVEIRGPLSVGKHIRRRGEDVRSNEVLCEPATILNAQRLGLLASNGMERLRVYRKPAVSVLATGSELAAAGSKLKPGQIYDSNRLVLLTLLERMSIRAHDLGIVTDEPANIAERIQKGMLSDILLISGGVSVGSHDYVKSVLRDLGVETVFWRINMKPGKPLFCGRKGEHWVFGLPGNPISCVVGFLVFIEPLIRCLQGGLSVSPRYLCARLTRAIHKSDECTLFMSAQAQYAKDGLIEVTPTEHQGSAMMKALSLANSFIMVPSDCATIERGSQVDILLISEP